MDNTSKTFFLARQPIICREGRVNAYELLYRSGNHATAGQIPKNATEKIVNHTLNVTGLGNLLERGSKAFINVDTDMLLSDSVETIPKEFFVLELLETIDFTQDVIDRIGQLFQMGYTLALDDVVCTKEQIKALMPVLPYISVIKLEPTEDISAIAPFVKLFKKMNVTVLAEKVETKEQFDAYLAIGCDLFQGYFFARPALVSGQAIDTHSALLFRALELANAHKLDELHTLIANDAGLTIQLLRYINSAAFSFRQDIRSTKQAISLLGAQPMQKWLTLMSYAADERGMDSPLLKLAQERSVIMHRLAHCCLDEHAAEKASFAGMLSLIDALLDRPMEQLLHELNIDHEIRDILLHPGTSKISEIFELVKCIETFDQEKIDMTLARLELDFKTFTEMLNESYHRTETLMEDLRVTR